MENNVEYVERVTLADDPAGITAAVEAYAAEVAATVAGWLAGEDA